jgi:hypothetical protein
MKYLEWQKNPIRFLAMTGCKINEFNALLPYFEAAHDEYLSRYTLKGKPGSGQRSYVIYSNSPLPCYAERLAFILSYLKLNPIQEHHADTFCMTQKQCYEFVHGLYNILQNTMRDLGVVPATTNQELQEALSKIESFSQKMQDASVTTSTGQEMQDDLSTEADMTNNSQEIQDLSTSEAVTTTTGQSLQDDLSTALDMTGNSQEMQDLSMSEAVTTTTGQSLQEGLSTVNLSDTKILFHDGTEREVPRPVDDDLQKDKYSGKKKKHTVKNAVITTACCMIVYVSQTFSGRIHDKTIADIDYTIPAGYTLFQDTGYQGYRPDGVKIIQPKKKPKGKELTKEEKSANMKISSVRVRVEHAIGGVKRYRIVKDECRLRKNNFVDSVFLSCAALHNFRLKYRPFIYENNLT